MLALSAARAAVVHAPARLVAGARLRRRRGAGASLPWTLRNSSTHGQLRARRVRRGRHVLDRQSSAGARRRGSGRQSRDSSRRRSNSAGRIPGSPRSSSSRSTTRTRSAHHASSPAGGCGCCCEKAVLHVRADRAVVYATLPAVPDWHPVAALCDARAAGGRRIRSSCAPGRGPDAVCCWPRPSCSPPDLLSAGALPHPGARPACLVVGRGRSRLAWPADRR